MVRSYARGSWRYKVASLVASLVAVAVRYGNVGGSISGNEELVASLMAECDGKNEGNRIWVAKGVATLHGNNWAGHFVISFWRQQRCQNLMAVFRAIKYKHLTWRKGRLVYMAHVDRRGVRDFLAANGLGSWWQKCWQDFGQHQLDVDTTHSSLIAPSMGATATEPMDQTRRQAHMIGWHVVFNNPFAGGAEAASAQRTLVLSRQSYKYR